MTRFVLTAGMLILSFAVHAQTEVPHPFQSGQPARAEEVNQNFAALGSAIDQNAAFIQSIEDQVKGLYTCIGEPSGGQAHVIRADEHAGGTIPGQKTPGTQYTIDGEDYVILKVPFVDHASGDRYAIYFPTNQISFGSQMTTTHVKPGNFDHFCDAFNNFPARWEMLEMRTIQIITDYVESMVRINFFISIEVGETLVSVPILTRQYVETSGSLSGDCCDLSVALDIAQMQHPDSAISAMQDLFDLVWIEAIP